MFACLSCGKADDESDIFFLKTLGEMPAQISLLAYVKPEQKKRLFTQELLLEWSNTSIAAGQNVQINGNIQVLNHCQGMAKGLQQTGAVWCFYPAACLNDRMMCSPEELLTQRRRTWSRHLKFKPVINLAQNGLAGFILPRVVGLKSWNFNTEQQAWLRYRANLKGKTLQCLEFMVLVIK